MLNTTAASEAKFTSSPERLSLSVKLRIFAGDIKIAHTVFALPFALLSTFLASRETERTGLPRPGKLLLIVVCMATARTVAMAANRLLDATLDARNPRTARRAIPSGTLSRAFYAAATCLCVAGFIAATAGFLIAYRNPWPLIFSVPVLAFVSAYPFLKRFSQLCHYYLGAALALAPVCAWIAIRGRLDAPPLWMAGAVLCWTAGFDIIYACQDYASDLACGVFSVPAKFGIPAALWISRATHLISAAMLVALGYSTRHFHTLYFVGVCLAIVLLLVEQSLVRPTNLSKIGLAFFTVNGIISLMLGTLGILDIVLHQ
ncbi:MAG TPA: UbiA-like polyprenyltransferase [Tepidisphaeraceae bacterium]|jgi:4-hydroxybenzoate polyprenyltransferase|nr:UbiA-like polyprenyltransferase [Tepidisphaeraceae bacterium]